MSNTGYALQELIEAKLGSPDDIKGHDHNYWCPFCSDSHLHVNYSKGDDGAALCHDCGYKTRNLLYLVRDMYGGVPQSIERLVRRSKIVRDVAAVLQMDEQNAKSAPCALPQGFKRVPYRGKGIGKRVFNYLTKERGLSYDAIDKYGVGYVDDPRSKVCGYAVFPFWMRGRLVYWQARAVCPARRKAPKNYNPPSTHKRHLLYGLDEAEGCEDLCIVEGPLDVMAWGQGALALTSLDIHDEQIRIIRTLGAKRVFILLDADAWDKKRRIDPSQKESKQITAPIALALRLRKSLRSSSVGVVKLKPYEDDASNVGSDLIRNIAESRARWYATDAVSNVRRILQA